MSSNRPPESSRPLSGGKPLILRPMEEADRQMVGHIGWDSWRSTGPLDRTMTDPAIAQKVKQAFLRFPFEPAMDVIVAEVEGTIAGWGAREAERDVISDIWISPDHQRRGIGRSLVLHFCETMRCEGVKQARISTHQNNFAAQALYKSCGFETVWQGMERDAVMELEIPKVRLRRRLY
ncbi:GNAT family N-acetyltransferase [Agrobacterium vitis]|uniref:GNAT family N-acetyltransferase n=1 Tax=Allorhizobium ampelinum TaxID=3025782 RepID=UPI001F1A997E|nr:GNAT family N-acetyltransferase [Allorhizobium ampelinum]MCF1459736.1 GNAT family N-acetyltransferase [Allorhizobium ampelinum]